MENWKTVSIWWRGNVFRFSAAKAFHQQRRETPTGGTRVRWGFPNAAVTSPPPLPVLGDELQELMNERGETLTIVVLKP